jgi:hypothetical protein
MSSSHEADDCYIKFIKKHHQRILFSRWQMNKFCLFTFNERLAPENMLINNLDFLNSMKDNLKGRCLHCKEDPISVFPEIKLRGTSPNSTFIYLWAIYIFPRSVHLFSCSRIGRSIIRNVEIGTKVALFPFWNIVFQYSVQHLIFAV